MIAAEAKGPVARPAFFIPERRRIGSGVRPIHFTSPARVISTRRVVRTAASPRPKPMKRSFYTVLLAASLSLGAVGIRAAVDTPPTLMSPVQFSQLKKAIESETKVALGRCRDAVGADREVCRAQARAEERIQKAELQARYYGTVSAQNAARTTRVKAEFDVAKARCSTMMGDERLDCLRAAREDRAKLLAET